jgi:hypothetical protein
MINERIHRKLHVKIKINLIQIQILVRKPEGKRPPGRPTCKWEDNIKRDLTEIR